ncbi:MAG: glycoside hydrolase family 30 protein [Candidatus Eremiobacteraeota bacterium]|nr:glycoside hydrolase family 30 protein [Candidatus Eremiobacteraeota bacterium]
MLRTILLLWMLFTLASPVLAQTAEVTLTAKDTTDRLTPRGTITFTAKPQPDESMTTVFLDPTRQYQTLEGIGGALTDAAAETFASLSPAAQDELLTAYFDTSRGIGYSLARTHINSCDFSSASYAYTKPDDRQLTTFSIQPDLRFRVPFIKKVLERAPGLKIFASPWSPPAWMKTNNDMLHGGKLKPEWAPVWARYYVRFVEEYRKQGIPIWGLTVQNEPMATQTWESCIYTAEEERDFVVDHLGPALKGLGLKLMIWDHNRNLLYQRASTVLADPQTASYVWGTAFHWYDGARADNVRQVHDAFPDKALLFSEGCNYPFSWEHFDEWHWGENYGRAMIDDFNNWTCAWTDWNILLDERGGPNHVNNFCYAPVHKDAEGKLHYMASYYYIGHFSKFLRPGARRIACTSTSKEIRATAFVDQQRTVAVVMNDSDQSAEVWLWQKGQAAPMQLPAHSIATASW